MLGHIAITALGGAAAQLETGEAVDSYFAAKEVEMSTDVNSTTKLPFNWDADIWLSRDNWETVDFAFIGRTGDLGFTNHFYFQLKNNSLRPNSNLFCRDASQCLSWDSGGDYQVFCPTRLPSNAPAFLVCSEKQYMAQVGSYSNQGVIPNKNYFLPPLAGTDCVIGVWQSYGFFLSSAWYRLARHLKFIFFLQPMKSLSGARAIFTEHDKSLIELI